MNEADAAILHATTGVSIGELVNEIIDDGTRSRPSFGTPCSQRCSRLFDTLFTPNEKDSTSCALLAERITTRAAHVRIFQLRSARCLRLVQTAISDSISHYVVVRYYNELLNEVLRMASASDQPQHTIEFGSAR